MRTASCICNGRPLTSNWHGNDEWLRDSHAELDCPWESSVLEVVKTYEGNDG